MFLLRWFFSIVLSGIFLVIGLPLAFFRNSCVYSLMKIWAELQLKIFKVQVKVVDENNGDFSKSPILFLLLNQTSLLETLIIQSSLPKPFLVFMNIEYALLPLVGWVPWLMGGVVIIREWKEQAKNGVVKAIQKMQEGKNFYMSIEGARKPSSTLHPYKKGAAVLAIRSKAQIVPIVIKGASKLMPYGEWRISPGSVEIIFKKKVDAAGYSFEERDLLTDDLRKVALKELGVFS